MAQRLKEANEAGKELIHQLKARYPKEIIGGAVCSIEGEIVIVVDVTDKQLPIRDTFTPSNQPGKNYPVRMRLVSPIEPACA